MKSVVMRLLARERGLFVGALIIGAAAIGLGIPVDFMLFALTLLGVALFHHHTLHVALTGLAAITAVQARLHRLQDGSGRRRTGDAPAARMGDPRQPARPAARLRAALAAFREKQDSGGAAALPAGRLEGRLRPAGDGVRAVVVPRQHRRGADRRHDGATVFRAKVHIGYLAAIVAASNAGGSGSVVGDTTTTMMWIDGVSPLDVFDAYVARRRRAGGVRHSRRAAAAPLFADHQGRAQSTSAWTGRAPASSPSSCSRRSPSTC